LVFGLLRGRVAISYSLYVWQQFFMLQAANNRFMLFAAPFLLLAVSLASYYYIEKPFIARGRRLTGKKLASASDSLHYIEQVVD
jgi:peptidoglycan/LPS O-acetylase OafA/YrhL